MNTAYLLLGGNLGDKERNLQQAIVLTEQLAGAIIKKSDIYVTAAWGNENQPDFYNQAISIETGLSCFELLKVLLNVEEKCGRNRTGEKWQQRTMDIDILFYNNDIVKTPELTIPHPFMQERRFVLVSLAQIAKELVHPVLKKTIEELLNECKDPLDVKRKVNSNL